jgi:G:T/U-mismatch repair DNA glycosylase
MQEAVADFPNPAAAFWRINNNAFANDAARTCLLSAAARI